ncbi:hypothetical protein CFAM422_006401 [Trichoderma lentiforme]|uniref:GATA-type domain-containing protein n=1 Tax=Trichoderma lentiforme TaxID=1567552 RepID=A0A9P4XF12_9HYPO|nr:hypothetical protein CFAM422_006401 [Trichoderma lentiforme]
MRRSTGAGSPLLSPSLQQENPPPSTLFDGFFFGEDEEDLEAKTQSPRWVPPPSDTGARSLKRYGSLSTFHGEGPIETSPTSAPRADSTDTIVPRPRDYSETQRLKEQEDVAEAAEFAAEQRRLEEQSRQLKELERESHIAVEKRRNKEIEYRRLKEEDSADAADKMRQPEQEFRDKADLHDLWQQLDTIKARDARTELSRRLKELERGILKNDEEAAEEMRRLERKFPDDVELHYARQELDAIKKRKANAEMERLILKEREVLRLEKEDDAAEAAKGKRRLEGEFGEDAEHRFTQRQPEETGKRAYKTKAAETLIPVKIEEEFQLFRQRSKEEDQDAPMYGDSIKPPYTDGVMEVEKRRGSAAPPGRCLSCNRIDTPLWRRGPDGDRTLCNACGLMYAKLERERQRQARSLGPKPEERDAVDAAEV